MAIDKTKWSFSFNGVDMSTKKLFVTGRGFPILPEPRVNIVELAQADGFVSQGSTFGPRYFEFDCIVLMDGGEGEGDIWTVLEDIISVMETSQEGEKPLILGWYPNKVYQARLIGRIDGELAATGASFKMLFIAQPTPTTVEPEEPEP